MLVHSSHFTDEDGCPSGGTTHGVGFAIGWQNGPLVRDANREEPNGAFVTDVIKAAIDRLEFYQQSKFASEHNENALGYLAAALRVLETRTALRVLETRTADREARGVEGTLVL